MRVANPHVGEAEEVGKETCHDEAVRTLTSEAGAEKQEKLRSMIALAEEAGEASLARDARERLRKIRGVSQVQASDVAVRLRTARLERQRNTEKFCESIKRKISWSAR